jgi:dienelactone hydrolase
MALLGVLWVADLALAWDEAKPDAREAAAQALVEALAKEDFTAATKDFDAAIKKKVPAEKLQAVWKDLLCTAGPFRKQLGTRAEKAVKGHVVVVTCQFQLARFDFRLVFNDDNQIASFLIQPAKLAFEYKPPAYVRPDSFRESEVVVNPGAWALPGTLTLPKGEGPFSAVVLVHGSGPQDRDETVGRNKPFRDLAEGLTSQGIAVLRYEKRTKEHGARYAALKEATLNEEIIDDALAAVAVLRKHEKIDAKRIFVLGHSLGAAATPRIGTRDERLAGLILLAGNTRPLEDLILEQVTYLASVDGPPSDKDKEEIEKVKKQVAHVKNLKSGVAVPASELPLCIPAPYWLDLRQLDSMGTAARIKKPLLILQGERDYQVTMADFAGWKKAVGARDNVRLKSYPKLNHLFVEGEGKSKLSEYDSEGHVAAEVIEDVAAWIKGK